MRTLLVSVVSMLTLAGCATSTPGVVRTKPDSPLVTIEAGEVDTKDVTYVAWYVVDRATETCWLKLHDSGAAMDCCKLRRVEQAKPFIHWENDDTCAPSVVAAPPAAEPQP